jgi:acyl-CoA reductase-like NAD-dependent aldehyde dehydrogenase
LLQDASYILGTRAVALLLGAGNTVLLKGTELAPRRMLIWILRPSVALFEVATETEALQLANNTEYGLTSAVLTQDLPRGLDSARRIKSRAVHINSISDHDESARPQKGAKAGGCGRFNSSY